MPMVLGGSGTITGLVANGLPSGVVTSSTLSSDAIYLTSPAGAVCFVAQNSAPTGWIKANGAAISRTTYSALFTAIGTTFGSGDGSTTFNVPDLRGEFIRSWDDSRGIDSGRSFGSFQASSRVLFAVGSNQGSYAQTSYAGLRYHADSYGIQNPDDSSDTTTDQYTTADAINGTSQNSRNYYRSIRPRNYALLACIKY